MRDVRSQVGPCPRDMLHYIQDPQLYEELIDKAVRTLQNLESITSFLSDPFSSTDTSQQLIILDRNGPLHITSMETDGYTADFKGYKALDALKIQFSRLSAVALYTSMYPPPLPPPARSVVVSSDILQ